MEGLSEATLEKFIERGFVREFADLFHLGRFRDEIVAMEGFGEKSYRNLIQSAEASRTTTMPRLIYGLGIANIGVANAKMLCRHFDYDFEKMKNADMEELTSIEWVGEVIGAAFMEYMGKEGNLEKINRLCGELAIEIPKIAPDSQALAGKVFVITGSLEHYAGRNELKEDIEQKGGKVTGSVTSRTDCLINNDISSNSSKNKKAKELNVPIITEGEFRRQYLRLEG
jgi:DNA ligase (NAD+)